MRRAALVLSFIGLAIVVVGLLAGRTAWMPEREKLPDEKSAPEPSPNIIIAPTRPEAPARPVAPDIVAIPPIAREALVRVDPRQPLSPFGQPMPPKPKDNGHIPRPLADAAGRLIGDGILITIAGVTVIEPDQTCTRADGIDWPCGMRARTAFRGLLRGRAVSCDIPPDFKGKTINASCSLGKLDLGRWIVANGWGYATPGGRYAENGDVARSSEKGIYGPGPALLPPLIELPPDLLLNQ